jgi:hypothetical protein
VQVDATTTAILSLVVSSIVSVATTAVGFGIMKEKVARAEKETENLRNSLNDYVTHKHFEAVIAPLRRTLDVMQSDIKEVLRALSRRQT